MDDPCAYMLSMSDPYGRCVGIVATSLRLAFATPGISARFGAARSASGEACLCLPECLVFVLPPMPSLACSRLIEAHATQISADYF